MDIAQHARRSFAGNMQPLAIALMAPAIVLASAAILMALLGIFVLWLAIVGALVTAIVMSDLARRSARRLAPTPVLRRQAVGMAGR
jgi:hypothetical protein